MKAKKNPPPAAARGKSKKAPAKKAGKAPAYGKRKAAIPSLGSGMMGLGGTGAQGMLP